MIMICVTTYKEPVEMSLCTFTLILTFVAVMQRDFSM